MSQRDNALKVWLDDDLGPARQVGTLAHDRGQIRFRYERDWLKEPRAFARTGGRGLPAQQQAHRRP